MTLIYGHYKLLLLFYVSRVFFKNAMSIKIIKGVALGSNLVIFPQFKTFNATLIKRKRRCIRVNLMLHKNLMQRSNYFS